MSQDGLLRADAPHAPASVWIRLGGAPAQALSPDFRTLASIASGPAWDINLWDLEKGRSLGPPLKAHEGWVSSLEFSPNGELLVNAGWNEGLLIFWDVARRRALARHRAHNGSVFTLSFSPDGKTQIT